MRKQVKFTFQIGYQTESRDFEAAIAFAASIHCGGCTTSNKTGFWTEDGASHAKRFTGALERERCFELELTCELSKAESVFEIMQAEIAAAAADFGVNTNWVHVSEIQVTGRHFSIEKINGAQNQNANVVQFSEAAQ